MFRLHSVASHFGVGGFVVFACSCSLTLSLSAPTPTRSLFSSLHILSVVKSLSRKKGDKTDVRLPSSSHSLSLFFNWEIFFYRTACFLFAGFGVSNLMNRLIRRLEYTVCVPFLLLCMCSPSPFYSSHRVVLFSPPSRPTYMSATFQSHHHHQVHTHPHTYKVPLDTLYSHTPTV